MGMRLQLYSLSNDHVAALLADPPLVWDVLGADDPELREGQGQPGGLDLAPDEVETEDLDKAWHGIHYLLTGSAWEGEGPLGFICQGGRAVGDIDTGYGPARALDAAEVKALAAALADVDAARLAERFDPAAMEAQDIYPNIWDEGDEALAYCQQFYASMQAFIAHTAQRGYGLLICMG